MNAVVQYQKLKEAITAHYDAFPVRMDKPCGKSHISDRKKCSKEKLAVLTADLKAGDEGAKKRVAEGKKSAAKKQAVHKEVVRDKGKKATNVEALNEIKRVGLSDRRLLQSKITGQQLELSRLAQEANESIEVLKAVEEARKSLDELKSILSESSEMRAKISSERKQKLERIFNGKVDQFGAKIAAVYKRTYEAVNPRKQIKVPKGTSQIEYLNIVSKLNEGDKQSEKLYTVPKPAKKKAGKKKPSNPGNITPGKGRKPSTSTVERNGKKFKASIDSWRRSWL